MIAIYSCSHNRSTQDFRTFGWSKRLYKTQAAATGADGLRNFAWQHDRPLKTGGHARRAMVWRIKNALTSEAAMPPPAHVLKLGRIPAQLALQRTCTHDQFSHDEVGSFLDSQLQAFPRQLREVCWRRLRSTSQKREESKMQGLPSLGDYTSLLPKRSRSVLEPGERRVFPTL